MALETTLVPSRASALLSVLPLSVPGSEPRARATPPSLDAPRLTCFQGCRAFHAGDRPAAHRGAGAQEQQVLAHRLQLSDGPFGGIGLADVDGLHWPRLGVID